MSDRCDFAADALAGSVALVTGAAGGMGAATARLLARAGATVAATDRTADDAEPTAAARFSATTGLGSLRMSAS